MNLDIDQLQEELHDIDRQRHEVQISLQCLFLGLDMRDEAAKRDCTTETVLPRALQHGLPQP